MANVNFGQAAFSSLVGPCQEAWLCSIVAFFDNSASSIWARHLRLSLARHEPRSQVSLLGMVGISYLALLLLQDSGRHRCDSEGFFCEARCSVLSGSVVSPLVTGLSLHSGIFHQPGQGLRLS